MRGWGRLGLFGLAALVTPVALWAQVTTGSVAGTVTDTQGSIVPGATVVLISEARGTKMAPVVTNISGDFVVPNVTADTYTVEVSLSGFKTLLRKGVEVSGGDRVSVGRLTLEVGGLEETVNVVGESPLIQSQSGERSFMIPTSTSDNLPLSRQNFASLAAFVPGVVVQASEGPPGWVAAARTTTRWTGCPRWTPGTTVS